MRVHIWFGFSPIAEQAGLIKILSRGLVPLFWQDIDFSINMCRSTIFESQGIK